MFTLDFRALFRSRAAALTIAALVGLLGSPAYASPHVLSPIVEQGEIEIESKVNRTFDKSDELNNGQSFNLAIGYGVNEFWATEIEGQWKKDPGGERHYDSTSWENRFQLTPQGKYWLDVGLFAEYEKVVQEGDHNNATIGLLLQKEFSRNVTTFNLLLTREFGADHAPGVKTEYRLQSRWRLNTAFEPGVELFGEPGRFDHFESFEDQRVRVGPVVVGKLPLSGQGKFKYEVGYLFGATRASERGTVRGLLEYETHF